ncbi:MAG: ATP-binding cassette domain-containing protein [Henriciella sp.]|uniref:ATP-binding cassette domain-containing protein n=1 Tax=Henriciella sp. TaxID=1968823 RepID=UPI003C71544D
MTSPVAAAEGLTKVFGKGDPALLAVDLVIPPNQITGLVGPDGAGKTTMIRILAGLLQPTAGHVQVLGGTPGQDLEHLGYMPQRFGLYEDLSVRQNLHLYAQLRGLPKEEHADKFAMLLDFTDLARFSDRLAGKLSGGMKQKLGLACALVRTPRLLLLDEPSVGVDPISRRELWHMVEELTGDGIGVLWSTAYLDEAERCQDVTLLSEGSVLYAGPPAGLTEEVAGRIWRLSGFEKGRRQVLTRALDQPCVLDGTIQGRSVRLLMADEERPKASDLELSELTQIEQATERFEDGFIERLGGGPKGTSVLAERYRTIDRTQGYAIEAEGLTKVFGDFTAASDVTLKIKPGQIYGLLGPNGAGKSTTFKMLCGLLTPTKGTGAVAGFDLRTSRAEARGALGYMAQKFSLYGDLSVGQNLNFFAGAYGLSRQAARNAIENAIDVFDLKAVLPKNAASLPLGYRQRLALACAVLHEPPVLFLDEPTSGVDPVARREFWTHINGLVEKGVTVLVTTHFMEEAEYCDDITLIYRSKQIANGTPDELKAMAATLADADDLTMEDAFIAIVEHRDHRRETEAAA